MDDAIAEHILPWMDGKRTGPFEAELRITRKCNLKCFHCPGHDESINNTNLLELKDWLKIINDCAKIGVKECLVFAEGEPMISNMALPMMIEVKKRGMRGKTATNGTLFTREKTRKIVEIGWDQIYISLDSPDAKSHNSVRGKGVFEKIMKSIKMINEEKEKQGKTAPEILFNTVLSNLNYNKLDKMIMLANELKISTVCFHPLNLWTDASKKLKMTSKQASEMQKGIPKAIELAKKFGIHNNLDVYFDKSWAEEGWKKKNEVRKEASKKNKKHPFFSIACYLPWYFISVNEDGRVNPCHSIHSNKENVHEKPLAEIWFGEYFKKVRENLLKSRIPLDCSENCCAMQATEHNSFRALLEKKYREK